MRIAIILWLFGVFSVGTAARTHWMVTESGLIKPRPDKPFEMTNSYDLLAFMGQETRWIQIIQNYYELMKMQPAISKLWAAVVVEGDFVAYESIDENCKKVGFLKKLDWFTSDLDDGWSMVPMEEYLITTPLYGQDVDVPDCKKISSLPYSMNTFDHLESVMNRDNLSFSAEPNLPNLPNLPNSISSVMTLDQFGHWLANMLRKNSSSWLHYNLASLYWRVRGNALKSMECSRRAVHYSPRHYRDIALLNMGTILHRCRRTDDAITVLKSAVNDKPRIHSHFVLANAYAVAGHFNYSIRYYKRCLKANPDFEKAERNMCGVKCISGMFRKMKVVRKILNELHHAVNVFNDKETYWLKNQALFLMAMNRKTDIDVKDLVQLCEKMSKMTGMDMTALRKHGDKNALILYFLDEGINWSMNGVLDFEAPYRLQKLIIHIQKHSGTDSGYTRRVDHFSDGTQPPNFKATSTRDPAPGTVNIEVKISRSAKPQQTAKSAAKKVAAAKPNKPKDDMAEFEVGRPVYPPTMKINRNFEDFDKDPEWPSKRLCKEAAPSFPKNVEAIYPVFLPFENKGIRLQWLLSEKIGVSLNVEHDLPWHPPTCPQDKDSTSLPKKSQKQPVGEVMRTDHLRYQLLEYVGAGDRTQVAHMQDAEIGQRIHSVMHKNLAPKWMVYTLASLYWRVRGNNINAVQCLLNAGRTTPSKFKDIPLISLASVMLEMGFVDEALSLAEEAFRLSLYEPATNFVLAQVNMVKKHRNTHMFHLKQVVRVEPNYLDGIARSLLTGWACILKQINTLHEIDFGEGDVCTQVEPGMSMVCERDGTNCHMSNIQCFSGHERDTSSLLRMLERNEPEEASPDVDMKFFDSFVDRKPSDQTDRATHRELYQELMEILNQELDSCGAKGCANLQPGDLNLKEEDCTHQHLQLDYWLHITNFKQLLSDSNLKLPPEIPSLVPSSKKEPECRLSVEPSEDFFLERLDKVQTEDWEPVLSLMHQFAEVYEFYDYTTLGAKIAKYVDTKPSDWLGALGAGWWCGAGGRGGCARRCLAAAYQLAPAQHAAHALRALAALLHIQSKHQEASDIALLAFYMLPKSKIEAFLVAVSYTYLAEYDKAVWMYRYALLFDDKYLPAKACLHATMCFMLFGDKANPKSG